MSVFQAILGCMTALLLLIPGIILLCALFPRRAFIELFFLGGAVGWALFMIVARLFPLAWWPVILAVLYLCVGAILYRSLSKNASLKIVRASGDWLILILGLLGFVRQLAPVMAGQLPPGEAPMFHLILAAKTVITGHAPTDWRPFASIPVNYAIGSHIWTAWLANLGGIPVHFAFRISFAVAAFFIAGLIYLVAREIFDDDKKSAFFASLLWITASQFGGQELFMLGQLPQMIGILLTLALVWFMMAESGGKSQLAMILLAAGILVSHQNTFFAIICVAALTAIIEKVIYGHVWNWGWKLIIAVVVGLALAPDMALRGIVLLVRPQYTNLYNFREYFIPIQALFTMPGVLVSLTGALGIALLLTRSLKTKKHLFLTTWVAAILTALTVIGYLYRILAFGYANGFYAVFTPSGLFVSLTIPVCIAAGWFFGNRDGYYKFRALSMVIGICLYLVFEYLLIVASSGAGIKVFLNEISLPFVFMAVLVVMWLAAEARRPVLQKGAVVLASALLVLYACSSSFYQVKQAKNVIAGADYTDLGKIAVAKYIPEDALILNTPTGNDLIFDGWLSYWLWKECSYMILPSTEKRRAPELGYKDILQRDVYEAVIHSAMKARPLAFFTPPEADYNSMGYQAVYVSGRRRLHIHEP